MQIVTGYAEAGNALVTGGVDKVIFVGSTGVGKAVMQASCLIMESFSTLTAKFLGLQVLAVAPVSLCLQAPCIVPEQVTGWVSRRQSMSLMMLCRLQLQP